MIATKMMAAPPAVAKVVYHSTTCFCQITFAKTHTWHSLHGSATFASPRVATVLCSSTNTLQVILHKNITARRSHFCVSHRTQHAPRQVSTTTHHARLSTERSTAAKTVIRSSHPLRMPILHLVFFSHAVETPGMLVQGRPGVRWPAQAGVKMGNARGMQMLSSCSGGRE